jgi:hypothetical protein
MDAKVKAGKSIVGDLDAVNERIRSLTRARCGEVYSPARRPEAVRIEASVAAVEPLPLVPAISSAGKRSCGSPNAASRMRISARENFRRGWPERVYSSGTMAFS